MCDQVTKRFALMEVFSDSSGKQQFPFPTDMVLQSNYITAIEAFKVTDVSIAPVSQKAVVNDTLFAKSFLTLVSGNDEVISRIPLATLNRSSNDGLLQYFDLPMLDITKCYISIPQAGTDVVTTETWLLGFHYKKATQ